MAHGFRLRALSVVVAGLLLVPGLPAPATPQTLETLELQVLGRTQKRLPMEARVKVLETRLNAASPPGTSVQYRIEQLYRQRQHAVSATAQAASLHAYNRGVDLAMKQKTQEAMAAYREALRLNPGLVAAANNLGSLLENAGQLTEALQVYETALREAPNTGLLHRNLGITYEKTGQMEAALNHYRQYLQHTSELDPPIAALIRDLDAQRAMGQSHIDYVNDATTASQGRNLLWPVYQPISVYVVGVDTPEEALFLPLVQQSLSEWEDATHGRIRFTETPQPTPTGITLHLQPGPLTHPTLDVGHAEYQLGQDHQMRVTLRVNIGEAGSPMSLAARRAQVHRLMLHELGHAIGIWGHSPDPGDVMFSHPMASGLSVRDVATINQLYAQTTPGL